jgi:hypothetical protein
MIAPNELPRLIESFFCKRLVAQRDVSGHTISAYRDTFRVCSCLLKRRRPDRPSVLRLRIRRRIWSAGSWT